MPPSKAAASWSATRSRSSSRSRRSSRPRSSLVGVAASRAQPSRAARYPFRSMKIALVGQGAFGIRHLEAVRNIPDIEVISLAGGRPAGTQLVAEKWNIPHWTTDLTETLKQPGLEAVIIASPTGVH